MTTNFSNNWIKQNRLNTAERIKESVRTQTPLKSKIEFAKNRLQAQNQKMDSMLEKLRGKEKTYFNQVVASVQKHDVQQGKMLSNELAQIRKTAKTISQLKISLEQIQMRLESTLDIGDVMVAIGPAMGALTRVKAGLSSVMPEVDTELGEINGVFSDIMINAGSMSNNSFAFDASGEDVDKILAEAGAVAESRMNASFPDIPIGSFGSNSSSNSISSSRSSIDEHSQ
jgi:division protein CdvB (Snf7/Vps24/ESCRT-III family)